MKSFISIKSFCYYLATFSYSCFCSIFDSF